jgi:hypothetical protein
MHPIPIGLVRFVGLLLILYVALRLVNKQMEDSSSEDDEVDSSQ